MATAPDRPRPLPRGSFEALKCAVCGGTGTRPTLTDDDSLEPCDRCRGTGIEPSPIPRPATSLARLAREYLQRPVRQRLRVLAAQAGVGRRFAPHQLRHAHAVEMAREGVPLNVIQRQLGHANLGVTSVYLQGIDTAGIVETVRARRGPVIPAAAAFVGPSVAPLVESSYHGGASSVFRPPSA